MEWNGVSWEEIEVGGEIRRKEEKIGREDGRGGREGEKRRRVDTEKMRGREMRRVKEGEGEGGGGRGRGRGRA